MFDGNFCLLKVQHDECGPVVNHSITILEFTVNVHRELGAVIEADFEVPVEQIGDSYPIAIVEARHGR